MIQYADILSFGGGVNSVALAIMATNDGWRGDIVFADTGCEWPETMCYLGYFQREYLDRFALKITMIGPRQIHQSDKKIGDFSLIEYCENRAVCPMPAARWCTINWKALPIERYAAGRSQMLGIAADEARRKPDAIRPLVAAGIGRNGCIEIIARAGLDIPQKSGCYICPFQRNSQWRALWGRHPDLFERAARLEENVTRRTDGRTTATLDPAGAITLRQRELAYKSQLELPDMDMDGLLQYQPCQCTV